MATFELSNKADMDFYQPLRVVIAQHNNFYPDDMHYLCYSDSFYTREAGYVPVGAIEFVENSLQYHHGVKVKPLQIPLELKRPDFLGRQVKEHIGSFVLDKERAFVKAIDAYKSTVIPTGIYVGGTQFPMGNYFISEVVNIVSEYRLFISDGNIQGMHNYSGDPFVPPRKSAVLEIVKAYKHAPFHYCLDIAVLDTRQVVVVEAHHFYSCGLYGFSSHRLPNMYARSFHDLVRTKGMDGHI